MNTRQIFVKYIFSLILAYSQILTPFVFLSILVGFQVLISSIVGRTPTVDNQSPDTRPSFLMLSIPDGLEDPSVIYQNLAAIGGAQLYYSYANGVDTSLLGNYTLGTGIMGRTLPVYGNTTPIMLNSFFPEGFIQYNQFQYIPVNLMSFDSKEKMEDDIFAKHYSLPQVAGGYYFDTVIS